MKNILILVFIFMLSCSPDFSKAKYKRQIQIGKVWKRKNIHIIRQGTFRDPNVKKEARQELIKPPKINFDQW